MPKPSAAVDAYIAARPPAARRALTTVRAAICGALPPEAEEVISYKIPAYRVAGRIAIFFAAWAEHYSLYPIGAQAEAALGEDLSRYGRSKGTIRFALGEPVPEALIERIARLKADEMVQAAKAKAALRAERRSIPSARARRRS
ncbi:MAG TPA: DUF1801 domain-containing protein [Caulobacteraceae bacterium]|nr:DUF1801 domain-containing protein [Caulobacteraceae bacterium]